MAAAFAIQSGLSVENDWRTCGAVFGIRPVIVLPLPEKNIMSRPAFSGKSLSLHPTP